MLSLGRDGVSPRVAVGFSLLLSSRRELRLIDSCDRYSFVPRLVEAGFDRSRNYPASLLAALTLAIGAS